MISYPVYSHHLIKPLEQTGTTIKPKKLTWEPDAPGSLPKPRNEALSDLPVKHMQDIFHYKLAHILIITRQ